MFGRAKRVVVGMSGGVDSTVSALLLKNRGFEVVGAFMRNWDGIDETGVCTADADCEMAESVAKKLGIKFHVVNLVKEYWNEVFSELLDDYKQGLTPNPDVLCNSRVKFDHFYHHAVNNIECDAIATGHYAQNSYGSELQYAEEGQPARLLKSSLSLSLLLASPLYQPILLPGLLKSGQNINFSPSVVLLRTWPASDQSYLCFFEE